MIKHMVLLKMSKKSAEVYFADIVRALTALKNDLPGIMNFTAGENIAEPNRTQGYTHGFCMDFVDRDFLRLYQEHPEHLKVVEMIKMATASPDGVCVCDYYLDLGYVD